MVETPLQENEIQLTEEYRISTDKMNIILTERYQKQSGKGRGAELLDEYTYGRPKYYSTLNSLVDSMIKNEVNDSLGKIKELQDLIPRIEAIRDEIKEYINEHVTIVQESTKSKTARKVKGIDISEDEEVNDGDVD